MTENQNIEISDLKELKKGLLVWSILVLIILTITCLVTPIYLTAIIIFAVYFALHVLLIRRSARLVIFKENEILIDYIYRDKSETLKYKNLRCYLFQPPATMGSKDYLVFANKKEDYTEVSIKADKHIYKKILSLTEIKLDRYYWKSPRKIPKSFVEFTRNHNQL